MASQWYLRLGEEELGPIPYPELIELVRQGTVGESDLVRREWPGDWQRADSVVGLFYMARREPAAEVRPDDRAIVSEAAQSATDEPAVRPSSPINRFSKLWFLPTFLRGRWAVSREAPTTSKFSVDPLDIRCEAEQPVKVSDFISSMPASSSAVNVTGHRELPADATGDPSDANVSDRDMSDMPEAVSTVASEEWTSTVAAALHAAEVRDAALAKEQERDESRGRVRSTTGTLLAWAVRFVTHPFAFLFGWLVETGGTTARDRVAAGLSVLERWLPRPAILRTGFKLGAGLLAANLTVMGILKWSDRQALRFPSREAKTAYFFPGFGACEPIEYAFFVGQVALFAGLAAYGIAAVLEAKADE